MKHPGYILILLLLLNGCVSEFIPRTTESKALLVVEGLITDQPGINTIKLTRSLPLGTTTSAKPVKGCTVTIYDDLGNTYNLTETSSGTYVTDASQFQGVVGRSYTLHISTNDVNNTTYESYPAEMRPVPVIDTLYYEKKAISVLDDSIITQAGCNVYLNTHDPTNQCKYYRWEYIETWEIHLPYVVTNKICWVSDNSDVINIKSTSALDESRITKFHLNYISNESDRLSVRYSMLVNQYSISEDEYGYWEKLQKFSEQEGSLYDMIPSSVPSNVYCVNNADEKVLGYFSVSASSSKRVFVKGNFSGLYNPYTPDICVADTIYNNADIQHLNSYVWIIATHTIPPPPYVVTTYNKGCADCTVRGTNIEPDYWEEAK